MGINMGTEEGLSAGCPGWALGVGPWRKSCGKAEWLVPTLGQGENASEPSPPWPHSFDLRPSLWEICGVWRSERRVCPPSPPTLPWGPGLLLACESPLCLCGTWEAAGPGALLRFVSDPPGEGSHKLSTSGPISLKNVTEILTSRQHS